MPMARKPTARPKRRGFFSKRDFGLLLKLANHWEVEALRCAETRAFYAACILAGASIEAMLLATCDLLPDEVIEAASKLKIRAPIERWGLAELLKVAKAAGWLGTNRKDFSAPDILEVTDLVRRLRNLLHPGNHLSELKQVPLRRSAFRVAWYTIDAVRERLANKLGIELPPNLPKLPVTKSVPQRLRRSKFAQRR
jgi:hypothetical protein